VRSHVGDESAVRQAVKLDQQDQLNGNPIATLLHVINGGKTVGHILHGDGSAKRLGPFSLNKKRIETAIWKVQSF